MSKTRKKYIKKRRCSPTQKKRYTCYSDKSLIKLKQLWNARHHDNKINATTNREIWEQLKSKMANTCNEESCWLNQQFAKKKLTDQLKNYTFTPKAPLEWKKKPTTWLSSTDITKVMKQYEKKYKNFAFIGPSPIDFDKKKMYGECVWSELCKFKLERLIKKGINKIGIIFNLDEHWQEGSHWVSLFVDLPRKFIFYFDSAGDNIPKEITALVKRIQKQGKELNIDFRFDKNYPFEHQYKDTECGMYSLYLIITLLTTHKDPNSFKKERISDEEMLNKRKIYFSLR
jgi:hypothetical protein